MHKRDFGVEPFAYMRSRELFKMLAPNDFNELVRTASKTRTLRRGSRRRALSGDVHCCKTGNILVANNMYDAEYVKHFTGLNSVTVLHKFVCIHKSSIPTNAARNFSRTIQDCHLAVRRYGKHLSTQVIHLTNPVARLNFHLHA